MRMRTDRYTLGSHLCNFGFCVRPKRLPDCQIMGERIAGLDEMGRHEIGTWDLSLYQMGNSKVVVFAITIIERNSYHRYRAMAIELRL